MGLNYVGLKMKKVREIVLGMGIILLMFLQNVNATTITWTGSTTGTQAWSTITNWSGGAVPAIASDLVINLSNGDALIITAMPGRAFNSLTINVASGTASIVFQGTGTAMTIGGNAGTDFTIGSGVSCTFAGTGNIANLTMAASATADVAGNLTIAAGSTMACSSSTFNFTGSGTQLSVAGTFTAATSTMNFSASGDQNIPALTYYKLTTSGSGTKTALGAITLLTAGTLTYSSGTTLDMGVNALTLGGTSTSAGTGTLKTSKLATPITTGKTWTGTVEYAASGQALIAGTYATLTLSGSGNKTLSGAVNVGATLNLNESVVVTTAANILNITNTSTTAIVGTPSSTNCIKGPMSWEMPASIAADGTSYLFPVADGNGVYRQIELLNVRTGATTPVVTITVAATGASTFDNTLESISAPNWRIQQTSGNFTSCTIRITQSGLTSTSKIGFSSAIGGAYANAGYNNIGSSITSNSGKGVGFYAIGACSYNILSIETFEGGTTWPTSAGSNTETTWSVNTAGGYNGSTNCARLAASASNQWLFTPPFTATAGKIYYLKYDDQGTGNGSNTISLHLCTSQSSISASVTNYINGTTSSTSWSTAPALRQSSSQWLCTQSGTYNWGFKASSPSAQMKIDQIQCMETDPATITWDGSSSTSWSTAANWDLNRAPTSSDIIVIPSGVTNYPATIPSGAYNEIRLTNGSAGTITIGNGTAITMSGSLTIASTGQPVTVANTVSIGGNLIVGTTGNAATFSIDSNATVNGYFSMGNASLANTYNFQGRVSANGNFTMGTSSTQTTNMTYSNDTVCVFSAANMSGSTVFYGAMNYNSTNPQLIMKGQYLGVLGLNNTGTRYMNGDLNLDENFNLTGGKMYASDIKGLIIGDGSGTDMNISPFRGANKSERWQTIIQASDLDTDLDAGDFFKALSFKVQTKASSGSFNNFVIKAGLTDTTKFYQDGSLNFHFKETPLSVVYSRSSINTVTGWNHFDFDQFLEWDGTKNILVEITWYSTTAPGGDDICFIGPLAGSGADIQLRITDGSGDCRTTSIGQNSNYKPQIKVNYLRTSFNINAAKDWNNTGTTFYHTNNTVTFDGSGYSQTIRTNESHFYNATFQNTSGYSLSTDTCTVENTLTMTAGNFTTGANVLELGSSVSNLGNLTRTNGTVIGNFKRWFSAATVSNVLFPLGTATYYRPGLLSFSTAPAAGGSVTGTHIASNAGVYNDHLAATPLVETAHELNSILTDGYWNFSPNTLSGGQYDLILTATGYSGINDYTKLHILKRPDANSEWALVGNHVQTTGSNSAPILERTGVTGFSDFVPAKAVSQLPIELLSFTATCNQGVVDIKWSSSTEINNNYYTVERSNNLEQWETIAQVNGAGNSNTVRDYMTTDVTSNSLTYYRLKQTDYNSHFKYFAPVSLNSCSMDESFVKVLVNPIKDNLDLLVSVLEDQQIDITFNNAIGEKLFSNNYMVIKGENRLSIDLSSLSPGIYFCNVKLNNGKIHIAKVVVAK